MRGTRPEPAEVWLIDGRPVRFGWRGRLYSVLAILQRPDPDLDPEAMRCWVVTASPGPGIPAATFRLCQSPDTDRWELTREAS